MMRSNRKFPRWVMLILKAIESGNGVISIYKQK